MADVSLSDITRRFGATEVLRGIDLDIADGSFTVIVGPSGCGKSTLLRILAGLDAPSSGRVHIGGRDVTGMEPAERRIAMVFQNYSLYPHMSVRDNMAFPLRSLRMGRAAIAAAIDRAAEILRIGDLLDRKPAQLSGGQRQRVAIGRAIVRDPSVFLFDEPLSNLDAALRGQMRVELAELHRMLGTTMVYVTHDQVEAMTMAERIVVLNGGCLEQVGAPMELYHRPATRFVAGFIGQPQMNLLPGRVIAADAALVVAEIGEGLRVEASVEGCGLSVGDGVTVGIRPDDLAPVAQGGIPVQVSVLERLGPQTVVHARADGGAVLSAVVAGDTGLAVDDALRLAVQPERVHVFAASGQALARPSRPAA
ncbi:ABC transporter ATP-binding protein [Roseisalinus antarcticus]|uniref:Maltose/maltodextrin import ATP-binding protein MalK n=1 Tax=Roseisalinus antarcticus TaxID=254357 RepID=A0A1Y5TWJ5_9RHOB|nr:sn-glycerol-3-phosphate ABC transporter ATP-binding protein UgpC [Roseisalinus antarcticus]SLN75042.1 Maltose/maltodextrin import ATP-binding protein MalK [Roseisalinus antarcticus]